MGGNSNTDWVNFYTAVASAAGAIFALFFVAIQVRESRWRGSRTRTYATFSAPVELAAPLFISLIALIVPHRWWLGARLVGVIGLLLILGFIGVFIYEKFTGRVPIQGMDWFQVVGTTCISGSVFVWVLFQGFSDDRGQGRLAAACVWLVMSGVTESWVLLTAGPVPAQFETVTIRRGEKADADGGDGSGEDEVKVAIAPIIQYQGFFGRPDTYEMRVPNTLPGGRLAPGTDMVELTGGSSRFEVGEIHKWVTKPVWMRPYWYYTLTKVEDSLS